jgi:hypothetical protein
VARTRINGAQVEDGTIKRADLDVSTAGEAVVRKVLPGFEMSFSSTGPDIGTGDVTVSKKEYLGKTLTYNGNVLSSISFYSDAAKTQLYKTLTFIRSSGVLTSIELRNSSNTLIATKTLQYTSNVLTGVVTS